MDEADEVVWMVRGAWVSLVPARGVRARHRGCARASHATSRSLPSERPRTRPRWPGCCAYWSTSACCRVDDDRLPRRHGERFSESVIPSGVRNLALMQTVMPNLTAWQHLSDAVRRGGAVFEDLHGMTSWTWLAAHPEDEVVFNAAMARRGALQVAAIRAAHDFSSARLLVDVGGGEGAMLLGLLSDEPGLRGIVADRASVAAAATTALAEAGLGERAHGEPGLLRWGADRWRRLPAVQRPARLG